ncbi:MAG: ParB/RepB/Spo0J family partition protein [Bacteriovoracaceae bacterium]|nr:ParB/RepB/Spo0J family partition protein [Bacteriovoracaceae bacterium]
MAKKLALGKGIASLIKDVPQNVLVESKAKAPPKEPELTSNPFLIDIKSITANPQQPRKIFKEKELKELAESIKENGIIQPLIVAAKSKSGKFELVAGERRLRASVLAGLEKVPVVIKKVTDREKLVMAIIENIQRSDLNCVEEALAYYQLMNDYNFNQEDVAKKLGKERSTVANFLRILKLPRPVIDLIQKDYLTFGHAKILAGINGREKAIRLANTAVSKKLTVRELEKLIKSDSSSKKGTKENKDKFFADKLDQFKNNLEQNTGFHFMLKHKKNGAGNIIIKYNNEAEFNDIYEFFIKRPKI